MSATVVNRDQCVEWSVATRPLPGQAVSGDLHLVSAWARGVLIAVVDGLGHGDEATLAARAAIDVLAAHPGESVVALIQRCHRALQSTRGAVMTLLSLNTAEDTAAVVGVGNVETVVVRSNPQARPRRETVLLRGGVVGYNLPAIRENILPMMPGDLMVFATDGVREDFAEGLNPGEPTAPLVDRIMARNFRGTDDGLVLACKYLGKA